MRTFLLVLGFICLAFSAQPSEAVEVLHTYDSMKEDTQELASQYPDIAIYSEHYRCTKVYRINPSARDFTLKAKTRVIM